MCEGFVWTMGLAQVGWGNKEPSRSTHKNTPGLQSMTAAPGKEAWEEMA